MEDKKVKAQGARKIENAVNAGQESMKKPVEAKLETAEKAAKVAKVKSETVKKEAKVAKVAKEGADNAAKPAKAAKVKLDTAEKTAMVAEDRQETVKTAGMVAQVSKEKAKKVAKIAKDGEDNGAMAAKAGPESVEKAAMVSKDTQETVRTAGMFAQGAKENAEKDAKLAKDDEDNAEKIAKPAKADKARLESAEKPVNAINAGQAIVEYTSKDSAENAAWTNVEALNGGYNRYLELTRGQLEMVLPEAFGKFEDIANLSKNSADAIFKAGSVAAKAMEIFGDDVVAYNRRVWDDSITNFKALFGCRTFEEVIDLQSNVVREQFQNFIADSAKFGELSLKTVNQALEPIGAQVNEAIDRLGKSIAA